MDQTRMAPLAYIPAISGAIFALNTLAHPEGTDNEGMVWLDDNSEDLIADLVKLRDDLYEKCAHCHLFVFDNPAADDGPDIARYIHGARGNDADERLDADHTPEPSGLVANLDTWKVFGPSTMRERFVTHPIGA
jgi:hypothetical protein